MRIWNGVKKILRKYENITIDGSLHHMAKVNQVINMAGGGDKVDILLVKLDGLLYLKMQVLLFL